MIKKTSISSKTLHKKKIRDLRIQKLEQKLKSNILKRKRNFQKDTNG